MSQGPDDLHQLRRALTPKLLTFALVQSVVLAVASVAFVTVMFVGWRVDPPLNAVSESGRVIVLQPMDKIPAAKRATPAARTVGAANG